MNNKFFCLCQLILLAHFASSQPYTFVKQWDYRYGGNLVDGPLNSPLPTNDGGFIFAGNSTSSADGNKTSISKGSFDIWIFKTDSAGHKLWDKTLGGVGDESLCGAVELEDGSLVIVGTADIGQSGDVSQPSKGGADYWVVKLDADGNKLWDKRFGGIGTELLSSITISNDNGFVLIGMSDSPVGADKSQPNWDASRFTEDAWIIKIDSNGNKLWDKRYGGTKEDQGIAISATSDGGYMLGCYTSSDSTGDKSQHWWAFNTPAYWIIKIDSVGNKQWDKRYGGLDGEHISHVITTKDSGFVLGGYSYSNIGGDKTQNHWGVGGDFWIVKIDAEGNKLWDKNIGSKDFDDLNELSETNDGGFLLSGYSYNTDFGGGDKTEDDLGIQQSWIVKTDSLGQKQWDKTIFTTGRDEGGYTIETSDGCYLFTNASDGATGGYKTQPAWDSSLDFFIIKFCMTEFNGINNEQHATNSKIQVHPNPFTRDVNIAVRFNNPSEHTATFIITNPTGQTLYQKQENNLANGYTKMLDLSYLPNGVYFVAVEVDGECTVKQVVKQ